MRFMVLLLVVSVSSCTSWKSQKPSSEWQALDAAESVKCVAWPKPSRAIGVRGIEVLGGKTLAFVSDLQMRTGTNTFARFIHRYPDNIKMNPEKMEQRKFGATAMVAGGGEFEDALHVGLVQFDSKSSKFSFELRTIDDNVVRYSSPLPFSDIIAADMTVAGDRMWLRLSRGTQDTALEDAKVSFVGLRINTKGSRKELLRTEFSDLWDTSSTLVLSDDLDRALVVWGVANGADSKSFRFYMNTINSKSGTADPKREIEIPTDMGVESWSAAAYKGGFLLAIVDGDSLVGQSKLKIARLTWESDYPRVAWLKTRSLDNEHVSEPNWLVQGSRAHLLLPKWVDQESTIAAYTVSETDIENSRAVGIFPNGLRIANSFNFDQQNLAIVRYRKGESTQFDFCKLGDL